MQNACADTQPTTASRGGHARSKFDAQACDILLMPEHGDTAATVDQKLAALSSVVAKGKSIVMATDSALCRRRDCDSTAKAVAAMPPHELASWHAYTAGLVKLQPIDWGRDRSDAVLSVKPLHVARRRAEALNRLYRTDNATPAHAVWLAQHHVHHLWLVKATVRVIGAERDRLGGQSVLDATQMADLQTINRIMSTCFGQHGGQEGMNPQQRRSIVSSQHVQIERRAQLQGMLRSPLRKREGPRLLDGPPLVQSGTRIPSCQR